MFTAKFTIRPHRLARAVELASVPEIHQIQVGQNSENLIPSIENVPIRIATE
jgi:hypothetical protein